MFGSAGRLASVSTVALLALIVPCTAASAAVVLPDGRGYELVSPPNKHGADIAADSQRTRAAADGSALSYVSLGGFGDVAGTGQATEYMAERSMNPNPGSNGWATHAITPHQDPLTLLAAIQGFEPLWSAELSPDLSAGVFRAWSPVTNEDPNIVNVENLYVRKDLRTPGAGSYQLLTRCLPCGSPFGPFSIFQLPRFAAGSADFSHVIFESNLKLTADAHSFASNLYESVDGNLRLAGVLPDSACGAPPCPAARSVAGPPIGAGAMPPRVISPDGSRIDFTDTSTGQLYQRINGTQTVQISASEKTTPDSPQAATYQTASVDGTRVFFTSSEQLTDGDTDNAGDLYMWEANASAGHHLTRLSVDSNPTDAPNGVDGVVGASDDGHYVYFIASGQLVANKPITGRPGIYVWHEGAVPAITYVGNVADPGEDVSENSVGQPLLGGGIRARVTPDGRHMAFRSHSGLGLLSVHGGTDIDQTGCDNSRCTEYYVYSADSDSLACASCNPNTSPPSTNADTFVRNGGTLTSSSHVVHAFSDDGRRLFFHTAEALVAADTNGRSDVYEYDTQTGTVSLISSGTDPADSYFVDASADGSDVFLLTRARLVGWDTDGSYDLYDARIDGGFPNPPPPTTTCTGDACQGSPNTTPGAVAGGSSEFQGAGNVAATVSSGGAGHAKAKVRVKRCGRGLVRKRVRGRVRCVKKKRRVAVKVKHGVALGRAR